MKDLLTQASDIAELHDLDLMLAFMRDVAAWRPEHDFPCECCQASMDAHLLRLYQQHGLHPAWVARQAYKHLGRTA